MTTRYGASPDEWIHFSMALGLTEYLLPVVSNPNATISPLSKMKALGKTPSRYNSQRQVQGIAKWTEQVTTAQQIERWIKEVDYGTCIQTGYVFAFDLDLTDPAVSAAVRATILAGCGCLLPVRSRSNSPKCLLAFRVVGDYGKRIIKTACGAIEFLGKGQQFIAVGMHPSGVRYEWEGGLPDDIPEINPEVFEAVWQELQDTFGIEPAATSKTTADKKGVLNEAVKSDPVAQFLIDNGNYISSERDGRMHIVCPFTEYHTTESSESATTYFPAHTNGYERGNFRCLHAHCEHRERHDYLEALGYVEPDAIEFEPVVSVAPAQANGEDDFGVVEAAVPVAPLKYPFLPAHVFTAQAPAEWIIKGLLPQADVGIIFGDFATGKSFLALDLLASVVLGIPWRGRKVKQGMCAYICAEGAGGFRNRIRAYEEEHGVTLDGLLVLADAPNFMEKADVAAVLEGLRPHGRPRIILLDTMAQVTAGGNENSGEDMGKVLKHCKLLHKATGALVLANHHAGKDASKGARGWSGIGGAADVMLEVERSGDHRSVRVTKMKDGPDGDEFGFKLKTVLLGEDEDGEPITSCVIEATGTTRVVRRQKLSQPNHIAVFGAIKELLNDMLDPLATTVKRIDLEEFCMAHLMPDKVARNRKRAIDSALDWLLANNYVQADGEDLSIGGGDQDGNT